VPLLFLLLLTALFFLAVADPPPPLPQVKPGRLRQVPLDSVERALARLLLLVPGAE
jgi:hypothetical protein